MGDESERPSGHTPGLITRPQGHLQDLPLPVRWEATRRHPYYQVFWRSVRSYLRGEVEQPWPTPPVIAAACLRAIGVVGEPHDPAEEFSALEDPAFQIPYL